jgi:hypothetical protein
MMFPNTITWSSLLSTAILLSKPLLTTAHPTKQPDNCLADPNCGPVPGESTIYSSDTSIEPPWPGNTTGAVLNTTTGPPGPDDLLFQNLLSAEWIIFSFYQRGVALFNTSSFTAAGFPNTTYAAIREIRNNEAGHLRIFQNQISASSIKPGPCKYEFPFDDAASYLALQTIIEVSSMAFLTGLELQARSDLARGALVAIAATETRHNTWSLMNNWKASPFAGPSDTYFPYANQILDYTGSWVVNGTCPSENPIYPCPRQGLPRLSAAGAKSVQPGANITLSVSGGDEPLEFEAGKEYFVVFFHGLLNVSVPLDTRTMRVEVPAKLEARGIFEVVLATKEGAPSEESVVAGPLVLLEDPAELGVLVLG